MILLCFLLTLFAALNRPSCLHEFGDIDTFLILMFILRQALTLAFLLFEIDFSLYCFDYDPLLGTSQLFLAQPIAA